jgi:hypothetical protein
VSWKQGIVGAVTTLAVLVGAGLALRSCASLRKNSPSYRRAHAAIYQVTFVDGRVILRNELSELYASDDNGHTWRTLAAHPSVLTTSGNEIWGAQGWPGHHERPSAAVWRSTDRGDTWAYKSISVSRENDDLYARLPAAFINEPSTPPVLLMSDFHLAEPAVAEPSQWKRFGGRIASANHVRGTVEGADGIQHGSSIYVASADAMYLSTDGAEHWTTASVPRFRHAKLRCRESTCYALLSGIEFVGLMTTRAGTNEWTQLRSLDGTATDFVPTAQGFLITSVEAIETNDPRGIVRRVDDTKTTQVGGALPGGVWTLEQAPDGTLWAGGQGAYRLDGEQWTHVWP